LRWSYICEDKKYRNQKTYLKLADSTHKRNGWVDYEKCRIGCFHAKVFPWLIVDPIYDVLDILVKDRGEIATP